MVQIIPFDFEEISWLPLLLLNLLMFEPVQNEEKGTYDNIVFK